MDNDKKIQIYVDLWKAENPIKTNKLMVYLIAQPLLALGVSMGDKYGPAAYFFPVLGILFSGWWFFCIGRTIGHQKLWKMRVEEFGGEEFLLSEEEKKKHIPWYGGMSSSIVCLGPVVAGVVIWLIVLVYICGHRTNAP